jgi:hypothetical protein
VRVVRPVSIYLGCAQTRKRVSAFAGIAKIGPTRWFWVYWSDGGPYADDADPHAHGFADSIGEAVRSCGGIETFMCERPQRVSFHAWSALEWRSVFAARRRKPNTKASPDVKVTEYLYHWGGASSGVCRHRITKKTPRKIFIEEDCRQRHKTLGGVHRVPQMALDRAKLESGRAIYINHGAFRGSMCGVQFTLAEPEGPEVLDCFASLGLKSPATVAQVKRAFRRLSKKYHPDLGGSAEDFRHLRSRYESALALAGETNCMHAANSDVRSGSG